MSTVSFESNYVNIKHGSLGPARTPEVVLKAMLEAMDLCAENRCFRILVDADEPLRHATRESIDAFARRLAFFPGLKLAIHCPPARDAGMRDYYVKVAREHGTQVQYFTNRDEALEWLGAK